jgi:FtsH-binding integral membrane protein
MTGEPSTRPPPEIRQALIDALEAAREDQRRFTRATWLLTPLLLAALTGGLAFLAGVIALRVGLQKDFSSAFRWVADLLFTLLFAAFLIHPRGLRKLRGPAALWLLGAAAALALLLLLSLFSPLRHGFPGLFWSLLFGLGMVMVVMLGASYEPADLSGLGGMAGAARDGAARNAVGSAAGAEVVLGCLSAVPLFLFGAWADIVDRKSVV